MKSSRKLYYIDSIHYPVSSDNALNENRVKQENYKENELCQISLLDVNGVEGEDNIVVSVPKNKMFFDNGKDVAENNFVFYDADNQFPFTNGNTVTQARSLISKAASLRKSIRERYPDRSFELISKDQFANAKVTSYHVNVGHGNCSIILIENGNYYTIWMVDCGTMYHIRSPHLENIDVCFEEISKKLNKGVEDLHISLFMLTHLHSDHYNGISMLFNRGYCNKKTEFFINRDYAVASPAFINILDTIDSKGCPVYVPLRNVSNGMTSIELNPTIIFPDKSVFKNNPSTVGKTLCYVEPNANNSSVVYMISIGDRTMMFPGDMEKDELDKMTASGNCTPYLHLVDYYCVSHHASLTGHLNCKCLDKCHNKVLCLKCCKSHLSRAIVMGKDKAYNGIYSHTVLNDFGSAIVFSEKDNRGIDSTCLILDWGSNTCTYLY